MLINKFGIAILFLWIGISSIYAQENRTEICADFRVNETHVDTSFTDNAVRMQETLSFLQNICQDSIVRIVEDSFCEAPSESEGWTRQLHVKTNVIGLGMGIANAALEVDVCKHLSLSIPVYYSAWDYFKPTLKFRTLTVQPEVRYWFNRHNEGWFLGAHFGYGYYNFALDDEYRTQDHNRETPSMGGGLSMGYRTHLSKNKRWKMEFSLGGGVYDSHYDKFRNEENGFLVSTEKKTWYGVDQAAISFVYSFNLSRKGGKQ